MSLHFFLSLTNISESKYIFNIIQNGIYGQLLEMDGYYPYIIQNEHLSQIYSTLVCYRKKSCSNIVQSDLLMLILDGIIFNHNFNLNDEVIKLESLLRNSVVEKWNEIMYNYYSYFLKTYEGQFTLICVVKKYGKVWFSKDNIGCSSLLWNLSTLKTTTTSSLRFVIGTLAVINEDLSYEEISPGYLYVVDYKPSYNDSAIYNTTHLLLKHDNIQISSIKLESNMYCRALLDTIANQITFKPHEFVQKLQNSIKKRVYSLLNKQFTDNKTVAVLFSGGIDSLIIVHLLHKVLEPDFTIELWNVAFYKEKIKDTSKANDRLKSRRCHESIAKLNTNREFLLYEIDISLNELNYIKEKTIRYYIYPKSTYLDESIGCALWFSACGKGNIVRRLKYKNSNETPIVDSILYSVTSNAKIVLNGLGADELLGGYINHRNIFHKGGHDQLHHALQDAMKILYERNLGRDTRIFKSHEKIVVFPFLDSDLIEFTLSIPIEQRCNLTLPRGIGEKQLLRNLIKEFGYSHDIYSSHKQAIQFGSRAAKMENKRVRGNDQSFNFH